MNARWQPWWVWVGRVPWILFFGVVWQAALVAVLLVAVVAAEKTAQGMDWGMPIWAACVFSFIAGYMMAQRTPNAPPTNVAARGPPRLMGGE